MHTTNLLIAIACAACCSIAAAQQAIPAANAGLRPSGTSLPTSVDRAGVTRSASAPALGRSAVLTDVDPIGFADPCETPDHTTAEVKALQRVLLAQLASVKGDVDDFKAHIPNDCQRKELVYYLKTALFISRKP